MRERQPRGKCRDVHQRACRRNGSNHYALIHQLVSSHSSSTSSCISATIHHPGFHSPANAACAYFHNGSDSPAHDHAHIQCSNASVFPITLWFRPNVTQRNLVCVNILVRYISTKFRPTPAEFIAATTAFPRPNWPQRHPALSLIHI